MTTRDPEVIRFSVERGVDYVDTADCYMGGENERIVGRALQGIRDKVVLATKVHIAAVDQMIRSCENSLRSLQVDVMDILQPHNIGTEDEVTDGRAREALRKLIDQGKVRVAGGTTHKGQETVLRAGTSGVAPIPESMSREGVDAGRVDASGLLAGAERYLSTRFSVSGVAGESFLAAFASSQIWLNEETLRANGAERERVREALRDYLARQQGIARAYTREELQRAGSSATDDVLAALAKSLHPDRMGDVVVIPKMYWMVTSARTGTATGSPYGYDTSALLMMYGRGVASGVEWTGRVGFRRRSRRCRARAASTAATVRSSSLRRM